MHQNGDVKSFPDAEAARASGYDIPLSEAMARYVEQLSIGQRQALWLRLKKITDAGLELVDRDIYAALESRHAWRSYLSERVRGVRRG